MDIPTWHRNKGTKKALNPDRARGAPEHWRLEGMAQLLPLSRARMLAEYDLADLILVASGRLLRHSSQREFPSIDFGMWRGCGSGALFTR